MIDGFLFINKERGLTSRKVCNQISFRFNEKKVGHIGTLDPFATGLLIVTLGKGNKAGQFLEKAEKTYIAELKLGEKTETLDNTSDVIEKKEVPFLTIDNINNALSSFLGEIEQIPPMTSAIHVNGVKLYKLAHKGIEIEREPRKVVVKSIQLIYFKNNIIKFECTVSTGTYIRVLANDIAVKLGTVGHLISLERTKVGNISLEESVELGNSSIGDVIGITDVLSKVSHSVCFDDIKIKEIMDGKIDTLFYKSDSEYLFIISKNNEPIAMYAKIDENKYVFKRGLF